MRQLTALDQQFLALEDSRNYGHVGALATFDPSTAPGGQLTLPRLQSLIAERLPLVPPFRWRLVEVPFNLDYGYWIDDPHFDLEFHVRELALAPPGTDQQLSEQVGRIFSRPLDRSRPLWECYLVHGLPFAARLLAHGALARVALGRGATGERPLPLPYNPPALGAGEDRDFQPIQAALEGAGREVAG